MIINPVNGRLLFRTSTKLLQSAILPLVFVILAICVPSLPLTSSCIASVLLILLMVRLLPSSLNIFVPALTLLKGSDILRRSFDYLSRDEQFSSPGNCRKPLYSPVYGDDGRLALECTGYKDTDLEISSYREQTDMAYLISRINAGDTSLLPDPNALYADVTDLPNTPIGMVNFLDRLRRQFDSLPAETREKFDNSFSRFVAGVPTHTSDESGASEDKPVISNPTIEKPVEVSSENE